MDISKSLPVGFREPVAEELYRDILLTVVEPNMEWLDLGCGRTLIREWLPNARRDQLRLRAACKRIVGIDVGTDDVASNPYIHERVVGDIERLPFASGSFDLLTAQMVLEHIAAPCSMLRECWRVLRPGGSLLFITPNLANPLVAAARFVPSSIKRPLVAKLQHRDERDIFPTHYRLNTLSAVRRMAKAVGFAVERLEVVNGAPDFGPRLMLRQVESALRFIRPGGMGTDIVAHLVKPSERES